MDMQIFARLIARQPSVLVWKIDGQLIFHHDITVKPRSQERSTRKNHIRQQLPQLFLCLISKYACIICLHQSLMVWLERMYSELNCLIRAALSCGGKTFPSGSIHFRTYPLKDAPSILQLCLAIVASILLLFPLNHFIQIQQSKAFQGRKMEGGP